MASPSPGFRPTQLDGDDALRRQARGASRDELFHAGRTRNRPGITGRFWFGRRSGSSARARPDPRL